MGIFNKLLLSSFFIFPSLYASEPTNNDKLQEKVEEAKIESQKIPLIQEKTLQKVFEQRYAKLIEATIDYKVIKQFQIQENYNAHDALKSQQEKLLSKAFEKQAQIWADQFFQEKITSLEKKLSKHSVHPMIGITSGNPYVGIKTKGIKFFANNSLVQIEYTKNNITIKCSQTHENNTSLYMIQCKWKL